MPLSSLDSQWKMVPFGVDPELLKGRSMDGRRGWLLTRWCRDLLRSHASRFPEGSPESSQCRLAGLCLALALQEDAGINHQKEMGRTSACGSYLWGWPSSAVCTGLSSGRFQQGAVRKSPAGARTLVRPVWWRGRWSRSPRRSPLSPPPETSTDADPLAAHYDSYICAERAFIL